MRFDVLTLFPEIFQGYLTQSLLKLALQRGLVEIHLWNIRDWAQGRHRSVDDRPFGGGPGMVLMPEPVFAAVEAVRAQSSEPGLLVMLTPGGERLTQGLVQELAKEKRLLLLCGRYEGFDERIRQGLVPREVSIGDFVCNGGEVPAMVVIDTVVRYVPGVLGDPDSLAEESHNDPGRLEYPQYTRPRVFRGMEVPEVLLSGNHQAIARWRREQSLARSQARSRPSAEGARPGELPAAVPQVGAPLSEGSTPEPLFDIPSTTKEGENHEESIDSPGGGSGS
jgi:tRNA (guanine37-N1)-methyltransferase